MTTLTAPRQSTPNRPQTSTFVIAGFIVVILAVAALVIPRLTSSTTTSHAASVSVYKGGGGGNASHHSSEHGFPGRVTQGVNGVASAVAAEQVVAMQRQYLDGLLSQQTRLLDEGTPRAMVQLKALDPQIVAAQKALAKAEKSVPAAKTEPQTYTQN
jgi:hypothetical protein